MKTSSPLKDLIPDIVQQWDDDRQGRETDWDLHKVLNNKLIDLVQESLQIEMISQRAYNQTIKRIPSINVHKRVVDKTSKVYTKDPTRLTDKDTDKTLMRDIAKSMGLNKKFMTSNRYLNSSFRFAVEPYLNDKGEHKVRVLSAYQFMPFSDSITSPETMTVYVKFIGTEKNEGNQVDILSITSDDEFMIIDTNGKIRTDIMSRAGLTDFINQFGRIPAVYGRTIDDQLAPFRNSEGLEMAILIPKLFADINFAAKYLSHSIMWGVNVDMNKLDVNADAFLDLGEGDDTTGSKPEVGVITPSVDIPNQLASIASQIQNHFETVGIKTDVNMSGSNPISAVSKAIDEADVSAIRQAQMNQYACIEAEFWDLVSVMQARWVSNNKPTIKKNFSKDFVKTFSIVFAEMKAMQSVSQQLDEAEKWLNLNLSSRKQVLRELRPELNETQIDKQLKEADDEATADMERKLAGLPGIKPDTTSDGQFTEGNQVGANAKPENNLRNDPNGRTTSEDN